MNPAFALLNACNIMDLVYGSFYAIRLLGKGVGPYGNGSWNKKKSGYSKIKDPVTNVQMKRSRTFRPKSEHSTEEDDFRYEPTRITQDTYADVSPPPSYGNAEPTSHNPYEEAYRGSDIVDEDRDRLLTDPRNLRG